MNARIASGSLKGRIIRVPDVRCTFRPTLERTRISVADILQPRLAGSLCADVCAGSGAMGFEMISRGAARVDFIENDSSCADSIRAHAKIFGVAGKCRVLELDADSFSHTCSESYDAVFYDPPYDAIALQELLGALLRLVRRDGILLYQRQRTSSDRRQREASPILPFDSRRYGNSIVELYHPPALE
jgi:16S rRNA (guanine966-N2)-methyltransferase